MRFSVAVASMAMVAVLCASVSGAPDNTVDPLQSLVESSSITLDSALTTKNPLRFHLLGIACAKTNKDFVYQATAMKVLYISQILTELGHTVFHYGPAGSTPMCTEQVDVLSHEQFEKWQQPKTNDQEPHSRAEFHKNAIREINLRKQEGDFLLVTHGVWQEAIAKAVGLKRVVEPSVGYHGFFSKYRAFVSYAHMHENMGRRKDGGSQFYDSVIYPPFEPNDFVNDYKEEKEDFWLYVGRVIEGKGVRVAAEVTRELNQTLIVAGGPAGNVKWLLPEKEFPHVRFIGRVSLEERNDWLSRAKVLIAPSKYYEPFGFIVVEAAFLGTPTITTDWGAFTETVLHGVTGFRCRTFADYIYAGRHLDQIRPRDCRAWATNTFGIHRAKLKYEHFFQSIAQPSWYTLPESMERWGSDKALLVPAHPLTSQVTYEDDVELFRRKLHVSREIDSVREDEVLRVLLGDRDAEGPSGHDEL